MKAAPKIYQLLGDGGYIFSPAFAEYGLYLGHLGFEVHAFPDSGRNVQAICDDILWQPADRKIILIGYSLGANGCAWTASALEHKRVIDLIVAFDPTKNGPSLSEYPLGANVRRAILFQQVSLLSPINWFFGRAILVAKEGGPKIETYKLKADHLLLQLDPALQSTCTQAIQSIKE